MADGRMFTQYMPSKFLNDSLRQNLGKDMTNAEYRLFLETHGKTYRGSQPNKDSCLYGNFGVTCYRN